MKKDIQEKAEKLLKICKVDVPDDVKLRAIVLYLEVEYQIGGRDAIQKQLDKLKQI